ncbi:MAG: flagellar hook assembly protein FlgD [Chloroflexi bacterium]|nr:flagellar hook assembly protein FlgD [Chloroflexota bacterium]MBI4504396.1 flagellar hook assembly protein FlgD [Chloroflexota bacterium]
MPIEGIVGNAATTALAAARKGNGQDIGKDDFLQLLIAQLRNQDPLKPMEDREFIVQLAQFRSLEQMDKMVAGLDKLMQAQQVTLASGLIGRSVQTKDGVAGTVNAVTLRDGNATLQVGGQRVALDAVTEVR